MPLWIMAAPFLFVAGVMGNNVFYRRGKNLISRRHGDRRDRRSVEQAFFRGLFQLGTKLYSRMFGVPAWAVSWGGMGGSRGLSSRGAFMAEAIEWLKNTSGPATWEGFHFVPPGTYGLGRLNVTISRVTAGFVVWVTARGELPRIPGHHWEVLAGVIPNFVKVESLQGLQLRSQPWDAQQSRQQVRFSVPVYQEYLIWVTAVAVPDRERPWSGVRGALLFDTVEETAYPGQ